jgi:S1-C subfamily serine protease
MAEGVAIPCDYFLSTMKSLNSLNEFVWPNLGIKYYDLSEVLNPVTKEKKGAYVVSVIAASSASNALFSGDIIKSVERDEISKERTLSEIISQYKVGETLRFAVLRDEKEITVEVKLK